MVASRRALAGIVALFAPLVPVSVAVTPASAAVASPPPVQAVASRPAPPPGAIASAFVANQLTYCSLICPHMLDFVVQIPTALVQAPGVYVVARSRGETSDRATGIAARSVTRPADSAMAGIIDNDLNIVLPRAQNALEVAVVGMLDVADTARSGATPGAVGQSFGTARADILDALNAPIVRNPPDIAVPHTPAQAGALDVIDRGSAVLFQAPEMLLPEATKSADLAAQTLASTGDVQRAAAVGVDHFTQALGRANELIEQANTAHHTLNRNPAQA
ncbi:hypothetical protein AAFP30_05455 [Gordonia sp. CPCC 205515]|uniref:hypothetical protein n=1 Tax=Gordonia sp. CPCC 205515 TaxID=3140791 RepID=UPI003AF3F397